MHVKKHIQHYSLSKSSAIPLISLAMQIIQMWIPGCSPVYISRKYLHPLSSYFGLKYAKRMHRGCLITLISKSKILQKCQPKACYVLTFLQRVKPLQSHLVLKNCTNLKCGRTFFSDLIFQISFPSNGDYPR